LFFWHGKRLSLFLSFLLPSKLFIYVCLGEEEAASRIQSIDPDQQQATDSFKNELIDQENIISHFFIISHKSKFQSIFPYIHFILFFYKNCYNNFPLSISMQFFIF